MNLLKFEKKGGIFRMELSMTEQGTVFLFSCAVGVFLGAFYDIFRIIRIAFNSKWLSVFFQDFIFCIFSALSVILLVYYTNSGIVRWFSLFGCFMSFLFYHFTVGRIIMFMAKKIIDFIKKVLLFIRNITIVPAKKLIMFIIKLIKRLIRFVFAQLKKSRKHMYYRKKKSAFVREGSRGFDLYQSYQSEKVPAAISRAANTEIKKQAALNKSQEKEQESIRQKTRGYKKSSVKAQSLGSLKSLSSIKFK